MSAGTPRPPDGSVVRLEPGRGVDGMRLLGRAVGFGRALRASGLSIDIGAEIDFARALEIVDLARRDEVKAAGAAIFVRRRDDRPAYDAVFDRYWKGRFGLPDASGPTVERPSDAEAPDAAEPSEPQLPGDRRPAGVEDRSGIPVPIEGDADDAEASDLEMVSPDAWSKLEVLRHRDFDRMTSAELRDAERLVDLLEPRLELRRTRRHELHRHGRRLAPRTMFRRNLATGGDLVNWIWQRPVKRPRPIVVLCDISGSMERHSRLLLRFVQALAGVSTVKTESFVFGTRLTRVTRLLKDRNRDRALSRIADSVVDWAGGTRIGESFRDFNQRWARRTLRSSGVVIVVSDGWDRGDPRLVATETARLRRNCHRLIWLNPLAGTPGYQPLAAGMKAAYPYIDDFLAAGTVASLERLGEILAGGRAGDLRKGAEAAAHITPSLDRVRTYEPPASLPIRPPDPGTAQPLR